MLHMLLGGSAFRTFEQVSDTNQADFRISVEDKGLGTFASPLRIRI